jgi:hypothetical protein
MSRPSPTCRRSWPTGVDWFKSQGEGRIRRPEVRGRQRRRQQSRRIPGPHGHADVGGDLQALPAAFWAAAKLKAFAPSGPSSGYLPAKFEDVRISFKIAGRRRLHDGLRRDCRLCRRPLHARQRAQRVQVLPQRILRQVRALPGRLAEDGGHSDFGWTRGKGTPADLDLLKSCRKR